MYRWRPTKSQRAAFAGKMADPVMRADYIARKEARAAKHRAGSRFGYPSAGGRCVPTIEQYHQAGRLIVAGPIYDLQGDGDIDSSDAYVAYTLWEQQQSYRALVSLDASGITNPFLFTGQPLDAIDNGDLYLYHYDHRAYDPVHARYLQRDPFGVSVLLWWTDYTNGGVFFDTFFFNEGMYGDGMNLYEFVKSNPLMYLDPLGLDTRFWDWVKCMADCIEDNDLLDYAASKLLAGLTMPIPKTWIAKLYRLVGDSKKADAILKTLKMPGVSKFSTIPNQLRASLKLIKPRRFMKAFGRISGPITVAYGLSLAGIEAHCLGWCCGTRHYDPVAGNIQEHLFAKYLDQAIQDAIDAIAGSEPTEE